MLQAFEEYLRKHLRASDIAQDSDGIFLFNVNQVAYLVEGAATNQDQTTTRGRLKSGMQSIQTQTIKCPRSGKGRKQWQTDKHKILSEKVWSNLRWGTH
jgi:hypothetical protein